VDQLGGAPGRGIVGGVDGVPAAALGEIGDERRPLGVGHVDREEEPGVERTVGERLTSGRRRLYGRQTLPLVPAPTIVPIRDDDRLALEQAVFGADPIDRLALASDTEPLILQRVGQLVG